ncbi:pyridoxal phosphate-dependent transferase [Scenedesmus sp. NREL 46B-D3]|nr:pyridoxal phosphate-dependent transferase [Scenedesmus sp. NREL 46B-D3]
MAPVNWEDRWSTEAQLKQLPSLHGIVSKFSTMPGVIGMHGGLPPSDSFPFSYFNAGISAAGHGPTDSELQIAEPQLVAAAQQYNMNAQGYAPLVSWAHSMVADLHQPATLLQQPIPSTANTATTTSSSGSSSSSGAAEPIGMQVVITQGSSAALDCLFRMLLNPGDPVLLEEYTYAHVVEADLLPMRCELLPVPMDGQGLLPSALDAILSQRQAAGLPLPRLLYTIPTGQNPTGSVMSPGRMAAWDLAILEDDAYFWLQYPAGPGDVPGLNLRPGFLSMDVDGRVIRIDTLSKLLGPGYRLGWLAGPPALAAKFALYTAGTSIGASMLSQVMIHQLLTKWGRQGFEAFVAQLQQRYARQAAAAEAAAAQHLAGLAEWQPAVAGMFMWFKMTAPGADSCKLIEASSAQGVMVIPGHLISVPHLEAAARQRQQQQQQRQNAAVLAAAAACGVVQKQQLQAEQQQELAPSPYFRVSFVSVGPEAVEEGLKRLSRAIAAVSSSSSSSINGTEDASVFVTTAAADKVNDQAPAVGVQENAVEQGCCQVSDEAGAAAPLTAADASTGSAASAAQLVAAAAASAAAAAAASYGKGGVSMMAGGMVRLDVQLEVLVLARLCGVLQQRFTHFDAVVSSDLLRTVQTAQVLAAAYNLQVQQHPGLRERNLGLLQGLTYAEGPVAQPEAWAALQSSSNRTRIPGGGESLDDLQQRFTETLLDIAGQFPGKRVLLVSHGGALHAAHRAARGYAARGKVINCGISIMMAEPYSSCSSSRSNSNLASGLEADKQEAVSHGRLALLVWNDGHELVAQGMLDAVGFGGSAKEA